MVTRPTRRVKTHQQVAMSAAKARARKHKAVLSTATKRLLHIIHLVYVANEADIVPNAYLDADLGGDELDVIELAMECEDAFGIVLDDDDFIGVAKVSDVFALLRSKGVDIDWKER